MSAEQPVDLDKALQWLEGDRRMLERIRVMFLKNMPVQVAALEESLRLGDADAAERMAHTIKGSAAMMGAGRMSSLAAEVERSVMESDLPGEAALRFAEFFAAYRQVMVALTAYGEQP